MTLHKKITKKLQEVSHNEVLKKMGYNSPVVGEKTLQKFIDTISIYEWLKDGNFDLKYNSERFLVVLAETLEVPLNLLEKEITKAKDRIAITSRMKDPSISANTNKDSWHLPFPFPLAGQRIMSIEKESLVGKTDNEIFEEVGSMIQKHYRKYDGEMSTLGKILDYTYNHTDGNKYIFDIDGILVGKDNDDTLNPKRYDLQYKRPTLILHIPHSSTSLPKTFQVEKDLSLEKEFQRMTDWFTDELFDRDGAQKLIFPYSRLYCDAERFREDDKEEMAKKGMGVCYTTSSFGSKLRRVSDEEKEFIKSTLYDAHHNKLEAFVEEGLRKNNMALIVDCHSFSNVVLPHEESDARPDICIGYDSFHTPAELRTNVEMVFTEAGLKVAYNEPFAGTIVPLKYYHKDKRVKSIMIEVNRKLYLDENFNKSENFDAIKLLIEEALGVIVRNAREFERVLKED